MKRSSHGSMGGDIEKEGQCLIKYRNLPESTCSRRMMLSRFWVSRLWPLSEGVDHQTWKDGLIGRLHKWRRRTTLRLVKGWAEFSQQYMRTVSKKVSARLRSQQVHKRLL